MRIHTQTTEPCAATSFESEELSSVPLDTSPGAVSAAAEDFGRLVRGVVRGVARPGSITELAGMIRKIADAGVQLTPRGRGLSQSGQSLPNGGVSLDLSRLSDVGAVNVESRTVTCAAGATFRQLIEKTLAHGLLPNVVPMNLDLSVGGVASAGGIGTTSHEYGFLVSNVLSAQVVLASGALVQCGPGLERPVFDGVFAGLGRMGVVASMELALRPAPSRVRTYFLLYENLEQMLLDQLLMGQGHAQHLESFCSATVHGFRKNDNGKRQPFATYSYTLQVSVEYSDEPPLTEDFLAQVRCKSVLHVEDDDQPSFMARYDGRFEMMRALGAWAQVHPWYEVLLPIEAAESVVPRLLESLPVFLADGLRLMVIADRDRPLSLALPEGRPLLGLAILPMGVPPALREVAMSALEQTDTLCRAAGGRRYLSGWLFGPGPNYWRGHYDADYERLLALKNRLDPEAVFGSMLPGL